LAKEREVRDKDLKIRVLEDQILNTEGQLLEISSALGESGDHTGELEKKVRIAQERLGDIELRISQARSQLRPF